MFRRMRRFKQELTREETLSLLQTEKRGVLALHGDDGYPYAVPMDFVLLDGAVYFHSAGEGHKLDALRRDEKACFTVYGNDRQEPGEWWYHVSSAVVFGALAEVTDPDEKLAALTALGNKYFPSPEHTRAEIRKDGARVTVLRLTVRHMTGKAVHEN